VTEQKADRPRKLSLGTRILIGILCGIAVGVFLGEESSPLQVLGDVYVGLLQMTVLPYVTVSLVTKIGRLRFEQARNLAGRACVVLLALWMISLLTVVVIPFSLPTWEAGTYFSASLVERPQEFDFLGLYLPINPFHSLANNVVPAVVLFSILLGVAMIAPTGSSDSHPGAPSRSPRAPRARSPRQRCCAWAATSAATPSRSSSSRSSCSLPPCRHSRRTASGRSSGR
jgi:Na+/H+-dicarboxylate symporter